MICRLIFTSICPCRVSLGYFQLYTFVFCLFLIFSSVLFFTDRSSLSVSSSSSLFGTYTYHGLRVTVRMTDNIYFSCKSPSIPHWRGPDTTSIPFRSHSWSTFSLPLTFDIFITFPSHFLSLSPSNHFDHSFLSSSFCLILYILPLFLY